MIITKPKQLHGTITVPGDKSISHRSIMLGSISEGDTEVHGFLNGDDCNSTISCFQNLGIEIEKKNTSITIHGKGLRGLSAPKDILDVGNSGTTTRLMSGILAGNNFLSAITGDASIQSRPMKRIITPLTLMGAKITSTRNNDCCPLLINGGNLQGINYLSPVASAQIKSCILFAGLYANKTTTVTEPAISRNHSEIMLQAFGASISTNNTSVSIEPNPQLIGQNITIPGDISSAAYFIAAGILHEKGDLYIRNVNINPTRDGILTVARNMGAKISLENLHTVSGEKSADLHVCSSSLCGTTISGAMIPTLIDEIPMIAVMAAFAKGTTKICDIAELKVKESDRIQSICKNLKNMGADVSYTNDSITIHGSNTLHGTYIHTYHDHRIAMAFAIAGLLVEGETTFDDEECVSISYPTFFHEIKKLTS